jgi:arylsulfatase A-like enzyme/Tfp pilus assembly protein PilF
VATVLGVCTAACGWGRERINADLLPGALRGANVLLVTIDTLRADRVGAFGGAYPTPTLDRLAAGGLRFTRAYAHAPTTLPAHASIFTGLLPPRHGVRVNGSELDGRPATLAELLERSGYRTGAFVGSFVLDARFGLSRGFEVYDDRVGTEQGPVTFGFVERSADRVLRTAADWLLRPEISNGGSPWFAWVHLFDPHAPYRAPRRLVASPYENEVAFVDAELGSFLESLGRAGLLARTLIVALSDHGEALGDHGEETHGLFAYESTIRIPLIVNGPGLRPATVTALAGQADLLPTIAALLGLEPSAPVDGRSLLPAIRGEEMVEEAVYFEALDAHLTRNWAPLTGIVSGDWKYIDLPIPELFELSRDPGERTNRVAEERDRASALARRVEVWKSAAPKGTRELDPDAVARLRSLGYMAASSSPPRKAAYTAEDDPKRLVDVDRRFQTALHLVGDGRHSEAAALLREAIARRPDFTAAYLALASVLIEAGHAGESIELLTAAARQGIADPKIQERLGAAFLANGQPNRAATVLEPLSGEGASVDTLNTLAIACAEMGARDRARALFQRAVATAPRAASIWNNLGLLELDTRRLPQAVAAFERAVDADPSFAPAWAALGATRASTDPAGAIDAWNRVVELAPADYDALFNLGMLLWQSGRRDEARRHLERFVRDAPPARYSTDVAQIRRMLASRGTDKSSR